MDGCNPVLGDRTIQCSAPCRIDMAGTLDLSTFFYPLGHLDPCTFNVALELRTRVTLSAHEPGKVKVVSRGFKSAAFEAGKAPFNHELGLMFAIAETFNASGIRIRIDSLSPPRSGLGGSSVAAVALVAAFYHLSGRDVEKHRQQIALLAHAVEQSVAGVPCGLQDHLAAAFGGVSTWYWKGQAAGAPFRRSEMTGKLMAAGLEDALLVAYCGVPHESRNINARWVENFLTAADRDTWREIVRAGRKFVAAMAGADFKEAARWMNRETDLRCRLTPDVLETTGDRLVRAAREAGCGARFTGAGAGGCIWALGPREALRELRKEWAKILEQGNGAELLPASIARQGVLLS